MDGLLRLLKDREVGTWCKQAAWLILAINVFHLLLELYILINQLGGPSTITWQEWATIVNALLSIVEAALFYFFILYAAGVVVNHLTGSKEEEEEEEEEAQEMPEQVQR